MNARTVERLAGALVLVLLGGFMLGLIATGTYWNYLNPKFMRLTGAAGVVLLFCGLALPFDRGASPGWSNIAVLSVFLVLAGISAAGFGENTAEADLFFSGGKEEAQPARVEWNGQEYVRMNTAEVLLLIDRTPNATGERVAVRGFFTRSGDLATAGRAAIVRTAVVCCLADALAMGMLVSGDVASAPPSGAWSEILGTIEPMPQGWAGNYTVRIPGSIFTVLDDRYVLHVDHAAAADPPAMPYIFEFREKEPYAY
ncbi:MAG: hypothetical protein AB7D07_05105 [Desulfovibrionaceae bacterium]